MVEIEIDPTTRMEGHHSTTLQVENGEVTDCRSHMDMFRGLEVIVQDRPPSDAPHFLQRICGVCWTVHRITSCLAMENAAQNAGTFNGVPDGARKLRNVMEGLVQVWDHAVHIYALAGPDYSDAKAGTGLTRLDPVTGEGYQEALVQQRELLQAIATVGGKAPHPLTYVPGGVTNPPTVEKITEIKNTLLNVSNWLGATENVPQVIENVQNGVRDPALGKGLHDIVAMLIEAKAAGADQIGQGPGRFYSNGFGIQPDQSRTLPQGVYIDGERRDFDKSKIEEHVKHSWYTDDSGGAPSEEKPPEPDYGKEGAYSWGKAPRYGGQSMEVGPLARMVVADLDPFDLRANLGGGSDASNTLNRLIARAQETLVLRDKLVEWVDQLEPGEKVYNENWSDDFTGEGVGLWAAPRGALSHWVKVEDGKIQNYQVVTPTIWNLGPRDRNDNPSVFEQAAVGTPVPDLDDPLQVMRTIRSFDPCLACSVHFVDGEGEERHSVKVEPASPGGCEH